MAYGDNVYMETIEEKKRTKINNFDCLRPNRALESSPDVCVSLVEWARHLLIPVVETNKQKQKRVQWLKDRPMKLYSISNKVISWKVDQEETTLVAPSLTTLVAPTLTTMVAPTLSNKYANDTSVLLKKIGFSLLAAKRTIDSITRKNADRKDDDIAIQIGIESFVQCIKNNAKIEEVDNITTAVGWLINNKGMVGNTFLITEGKNSDNGGSVGTMINNDSSSDYKPHGGGNRSKHNHNSEDDNIGDKSDPNHTGELSAKVLLTQRIVMVFTVMMV